jgi:DNA repair exonuclease SbcCD nuclease subunit
MIVFSDLHLCEDTAETVFEQVLPGILEAVQDDSDRTIACLGDFYHIRYKIPVALQNRVAAWLRKLRAEKVSLIFLPGNHDQINGAGEHALEVFADNPLVQIITEPAWNQYGLWIPYRKDPVDILEALIARKPTWLPATPPQVLWMHHGVKGAEMAPGVLGEIGLEPRQFQPWKLVLCGHFHKRQQLGNIIYVGSPYQVDASEAGQAKGYGRWNPITEQFFWVDTVWGKRYHQFDSMGVTAVGIPHIKEYIQDLGIHAGDEVRVASGAGYDAETLTRELQALGVRCIVAPAEQNPEIRLEVASTASMEDYARAYVGKLAPEMDREALLSVYREITGGVHP